MLFAPPTLAPGTSRPVAPTAGMAAVSGLGVFSPQAGLLGTAIRSVVSKTVVRSAFHGWLAGRRPVTFQAERKKQNGTALLSPFTSRLRTGFHGWFAVRAAGHFSDDPDATKGTATHSGTHDTVVRSAFHGWLAGRRPVTFQAERKKQNGTALLSPLTSRLRTGFHGWFAVRAAGHFSNGSNATKGTAAHSERHDTVVRSGFHGWFAERRPVDFMGVVPDGGAARGADYHVSVLPRETAEWMEAGPEKFLIDGTLGAGGHSESFLRAGARVLGVDRDPEALAYATRRLAPYGDRFRTWQGNFADLRDHPEVQGGERADGLLLDLGVSSRQLDAAERGFSFRGDGPLDMRMGPSVETTAAELVNGWAEDELVRILREYGEEKKARRIAKAIVERRAERPFERTTDLAECIARVVGRHGRAHPATRSFQAIRIAVNDELGSLERALEASTDLLKPGGRLVVITFHSLEDRMVKRFLRERSERWVDRPDWPEPRPNPRRCFRLPQRKAIAPSEQEIQVNPRARSAKLRVAELLDPNEI